MRSEGEKGKTKRERERDKLDMSSDKGWRFHFILPISYTRTLIRETASSACIIRVDFVGWPSHTNWVDPRYRARNKTPSISTVVVSVSNRIYRYHEHSRMFLLLLAVCSDEKRKKVEENENINFQACEKKVENQARKLVHGGFTELHWSHSYMRVN